MAYTKMGSPIDYMNMKQLRFRARTLGVAYNLSTTKAALITAIKLV